MKRIELLDDSEIDISTYTSTTEISRIDLVRNGVFYDIPIVRARVTTALSGGTGTTRVVKGFATPFSSGGSGSIQLGALAHGGTDHKNDVGQVVGTAAGSWMSVRLTSRADAAASYFAGNGGGPGVWERYFYYRFDHDYGQGIVAFDVILMSSGFAGYSVGGKG